MSAPNDKKSAGRTVPGSSPLRAPLTDELAAAVPVLLPELRAICVDYTARRFVEWVVEHPVADIPTGVTFSPAAEPPPRKGPRPPPAWQDSAIDPAGTALVDGDQGVCIAFERRLTDSASVYGRSTLRESGLTRWAVLLADSADWSNQFVGVTARLPSFVGDHRSDPSAVMYDTSRATFASRATDGPPPIVDAYDAKGPVPLPPPTPTLQNWLEDWQTARLPAGGAWLVLTFDADLQANTLALQLHCSTNASPGPWPGPSKVLRVTFPVERPLADMRPKIAMWGNAVFCDVEPGPVFPRQS